ncbi:MAG: AAA family ATPase [Synergistaceae bacterium]|nr:AAA family ATPase [Synergistaceae bacterium]
MKVVSVINYKGGVGKTTLTANLGAYVAMRGYRVLLIDLDPQTHLTFSFITLKEWREKYKDTRTLMHYFNALIDGKPRISISSLAIPTRAPRCKQLDIVSSNLSMTDMDILLTGSCSSSVKSLLAGSSLRMYNYLSSGLEEVSGKYDLVLIDCPPNCNAMVRNALIASRNCLIPARMDYLSSLGIDNLRSSMFRFLTEYNGYVRDRSDMGYSEVGIRMLGVVPMMVGFQGGHMINAHKMYMKKLKEDGYHVFPYLRESQKNFSVDRVKEGPLVLTPEAAKKGTKESPLSRILQDLYAIGDEFLLSLNE